MSRATTDSATRGRRVRYRGHRLDLARGRAWGTALGALVTLAGGLGAAPAHAQAAAFDSNSPFGAAMNDQRLFAHALLDQFEADIGNGNTDLAWEGEAWAGDDVHRLWLRSEGTAAGSRGRDSQNELLYDQPLSSYFDWQAGLRYDLGSGPGRGWAALGIAGLAPYFIQTTLTAYASDAGHYAARLQLAVDEPVTQRLIAQPQLEVNAYSRGPSQLQTGLRLRYEISRKFAPYLGLTYGSDFGHGIDTAATSAPVGAWPGNGLRLALGLRAWL